MLRLTLRNLAAHKGRFAMTTFAVVLGVGFVVASFVMSDGLRSTFAKLSEEITAGAVEALNVRDASRRSDIERLGGCRADLFAGTDEDDAERALVFQALGDHLFVSLFEDVER